MTSSSSSRQPRKDAQQNRAHILQVAGHAFVNDGVDVSMDAIAKLAGVGNATLYRHFPTKEDLVVALLAPHHEKLEQKKASIEQGDGHTGLMLEQWIEALGDWMLAYDGLPEPLRAAWSITDSPLKSTCDGLIASTESFLRAAQRDGFARPTLSAQDVFLGSLAVAWASGRRTARPDTRPRLRNVFRNGWSTEKDNTDEQPTRISEPIGTDGVVEERHRSLPNDR